MNATMAKPLATSVSAAAPLAGADAVAMGLVTRGAPAAAAGVAGWWRDEGHEAESLAEFLTRQQIFIVGAAKTIGMIQKGYVQMQDGSHLFTEQGVEKLRARFGAPPAPPVAPAVPPPPPAPLESPPGVKTVVMAAADATASPRLPSLEIGSTLGKCLLTEVLGQGGCGMVFRALHRGLNIPVAVKVIQRQLLASDPQVYQRLKAEARLLAQLNHPHVVRVLDFEDDENFPFVVMEYVEGLSLAELIQQSGSLRLYKAVRTIGQIAQGLAAAQEMGIVHRDVKPGNILLARNGTAKLADLGLAVVVGAPSAAQCLGARQPHDELAGTVAYMAPEQFSTPSAIDFRCDVYGLGATLYHALTGQLPFTGANTMEVMVKHVEEMPTPPHQLVADLDEAATEVVFRMMAKRPADRYQTYDDLQAALIQLVTRSATQPGGTLHEVALESQNSHSTTASGQPRSSRWKGLWSYFSRDKNGP